MNNITLTTKEQSDLQRLESVIEADLQTYLHVGTALMEIRDRRLYRLTHQAFEDYCRDRWGFSKSHGNRLINAAETAARINKCQDGQQVTPAGVNSYPFSQATERHLRELNGLAEKQQRQVWDHAVENAVGSPTADDVASARRVLEASWALEEAAGQEAAPRPPKAKRKQRKHGESVDQLGGRYDEVFATLTLAEQIDRCRAEESNRAAMELPPVIAARWQEHIAQGLRLLDEMSAHG